MTIRISGDGQYRVDRSVLDPLDAIDDLLEDALQAELVLEMSRDGLVPG